MRRVLLALGLLALALPASAAPAEQVNVYSSRHDSKLAPLLDRFTEKTGIEVGLITGNSDAMIKRLEIEGERSPADMLVTVDVARLQRATEAGLFRSIESDKLDTAIPDHLRDPKNRWFGLSERARVIAFDRDEVEREALSTYEALADNRWEGRICIRSSDNVYNQSLLASLIAAHGKQFAEDWAAAIVDNMARPPQGGDTAQIRAVAAGVCDVAVVNTYYYARMLQADKGSDAREAAQQVGLFFPNQDGRGAHVNVTGAGVLADAPHPEAAKRLLEFLARPESQAWLARVNNEYPVREGVEVSELVRSLGEYPFRADNQALGRIGELNGQAVRIFDRVGWR